MMDNKLQVKTADERYTASLSIAHQETLNPLAVCQ